MNQTSDTARNRGRALSLWSSVHAKVNCHRGLRRAHMNHLLIIRKSSGVRSTVLTLEASRAIEIPYSVDHRVRREPQRLNSNDPIGTARQSSLDNLTSLRGQSR